MFKSAWMVTELACWNCCQPHRQRLAGNGRRSWTDLRRKDRHSGSYFQMSSQVNFLSMVSHVVHAPCAPISTALAKDLTKHFVCSWVYSEAIINELIFLFLQNSGVILMITVMNILAISLKELSFGQYSLFCPIQIKTQILSVIILYYILLRTYVFLYLLIRMSGIVPLPTNLCDSSV